MAPPTYFPLRWESTGDQWWYASPIDWAAANGHYDLVRELLRIDPNHIIKLTSLRRIRRLETVWDDEEHFHDVARCRSEVARKLFAASNNSLVGAGYGGWLLYTAASAGDLGFVRELLEMDPLLVFGEGEYGVTDILYAAARSKNSQVFGYVFDHAASPRFSTGAEYELPPGYKLEIMNRAVHAAARGGNLKLLKELISSSPSNDLLAYRDNQGATMLHAAAARSQVEVVKHLSLSSPDILKLTDNGGNTALHVASHRGHLPVVQALIQASPSCVNVTSSTGETFIHSAVSGFQTPGFQRVDRQMDLLKHLLSSKLVDIKKLINARNNDGRTALHLAIMGNVHSDLVELLMTVPGIDINICDTGGMTPLDILRHSPSSDLLTRQLISAGGIFGCQDRRAIASHIKRQSIGGSPGTSFRISDIDIFLYSSAHPNSNFDMTNNHSLKSSCNLPLKADSAAQRLKRFLHWPNMRKGTTAPERLNEACSERGHVPLRQRFSKTSLSLPNNKRRLSVRSNVPSPTVKKKLASGVEHDMLQFVSRLKTQKGAGEGDWCSSSGVSDDIYCGAKNQKRLMNQYLCFGHGPRQPTGVVRSVLSAA